MSLEVSVKAVLLDDEGRVLLGRNPRDDWELLGGRPDPEDATPQDTLRRELLEEAGLAIDVGPILDSWIYDLGELGRICIVTYRATPAADAALEVSAEHSDLRWFTVDEALAAPMPQGYKDSLLRAR
jgi:8-oxo-dGTP pyrophosphatase MutT (NUDIX family)